MIVRAVKGLLWKVLTKVNDAVFEHGTTLGALVAAAVAEMWDPRMALATCLWLVQSTMDFLRVFVVGTTIPADFEEGIAVELADVFPWDA